MQDILSGFDLFNTIMMERQVEPKLIILMESEEDCSVVDLHLDHSVAESVAGYGKPSVLEAAELFHAEGVDEVLPFVDSDFDQRLGVDTYPPNVAFTDHYDLEMDILNACPGILEGMILSFSEKSAREAHIKPLGLTPGEVVLQIALPIGALRFCSMRDGLGLNMKKFPAEFAVAGYEDGRLEPAILEIAKRRSDASAGPIPSESDFSMEIAAVDPLVTYNGHDVFLVLSRLLSKVWNNITISSKLLEASVRGAVGCDCFRKLRLYVVVAEWGERLGKAPLTC